MIMEENTRSGDSSGVVVKNRNSSGCLIIKKKAGGGGSLGSRPVFDSKKEKKRPRLMVSDSGSSDDVFEPYRRRIGQACNGYEKGIVEERDSGRKNNSLDHIKKRSDVDEGERKRSKLDIFEFDEYDFTDGRKLKKEYMVDRDVEIGGRSFLAKPVGGSGIRMEYETGSSKGDIVYRRKHSYFDSSSSLIGKNRGNEYPVKNKFETKRDIAQKPVSLSREKFGNTSEEPIRVQGRNGVLKLMPNKKNKGSGLLKTYDRLEADDYRKGLRSVDTVKRNESARHLFFSEPKVQEKAGSSVRTAKNKLKLGKSLVTKSSMSTDSESDDSDMSLKLGPKKVEGNKSAKLVSGKGEITPPSENIQLTGSNDGKIKRGSGTEKQKLRQQIRKMLLDAGWTIDYRPRRNRDYQDAVYVNPSGTAYWSIIKAYDALQKQFDEEDDNLKPAGESSSFTPISGDVLNKLTRQTRKKIEKEMKRKHRDEAGTRNAREAASKKSASHKHDSKNMGSARAEEKLSSFLKQGGKSSKGKINENALVSPSVEVQNSTDLSHEANHMSMDNSSGNLSLHGRKSRKLGRCTLVVRSANKELNSETDGYVPNAGKLTLLSWLIDSGIVGSSEKVQYMNRRRTRVMQEGWITREGIHCGCCSKILTVSKFEIHAGSKLRQPFQNIYLETGSSLLQCQIDAWNRQEESERSSFHSVYIDGDDPNDDTCGICGDGGDLICCDGCPSTFHQNCLGIQMLPTGDWHCPNCTCKFCGMAGGGSARGNNVFSLGTCSLCEKKYHLSCMQDVDALPVDSTVPSTFCGQNCRELFENLQKFLGIKHELEAGFSWSLIHRTDIDPDTSLRGFPQKVESNSKLAVALTVMDECFLPIVDRRSGINLIHNVLYNCGSNFSRLNYCGFYTAILERGDEIISAASIRFHGTQLAEMPFIGTRHIYRRQGMCRRLFLAIESALRSFKVEKLIIPAISELMHTWTEVFGFNYLEESQRQELRFMNMLVFPGIDMLQKMLMEEENHHQDMTTNTGAKPMKVEGQHSSKSETLDKVDQDPFSGKDPFESHDDGVPHMKASDDEVTASDSASQSLEVALNDSPSSLGVPEVEVPVSSKKIMSPSSQSGDKVSESATELKSIFLADSSNEDRKMQDNPILDSPGGEIKSSAEGGVDAVNVCKNAASVEPVFHSLETISQHNDTGKGDENMKATPVSSSRSADRSSMPLDSGLDCHSPDVKEGQSCEASKAPCNAIHSDNTSVQVSAECSGTNICGMRTDSQSGQNLAESASDSRTDVFDVITRSHSGDYLAESTPVAKCLSPSDVNQAASKLETEPALDALGACRSPSSLDAGIDGLSVNGGVACLEPVLHTLGEDSGHDRSKEEIGEDTSANFVSNSDSIKESIVQFNLDSSSKNASYEVGINLSGPSEVAAGGMHSKESIDYLSGEC